MDDTVQLRLVGNYSLPLCYFSLLSPLGFGQRLSGSRTVPFYAGCYLSTFESGWTKVMW